MQAVYEAENSIDAHLARAWLEQAGLSPWVRGEFLGGALGELPAHGLIAVCVPVHQVEAARRALDELARVRAADGDGAPASDDDGPDNDDWVRV